MFCIREKVFSPFFAASRSYHSTYCPTTYSGLLISIGATKHTTDQPMRARMKRGLRLTKKKNAKPTTP